MLSEADRRIDAKVNYEKSDLLQILRMLKSYDLLRDDGQLEFYTPPQTRARARVRRAAGRTGVIGHR